MRTMPAKIEQPMLLNKEALLEQLAQGQLISI